MTEKLYYIGPYKNEWTTDIVSSVKNGNNKYEVRLAQTYFYPEGGGQPGDKGIINNVPVLDTVKKDDDVVCICKSEVFPGKADCKLDWEHRWDYMQQHTGQHILSAVLKYQLDIDTVSVHEGEDYTAIETNREEISEEEMIELNKQANLIIMKNLPVVLKTIDSSQLDKFPVRRPTSRQGLIRLVEIGDYDRAACGGLHLARTGEVRLINVFAIEKIRGRCRIQAKIGDRALADYGLKNGVCSDLGAKLSAQTGEIISMYEAKIAALEQQKIRNAALERKLAEVLYSSVKKEELGAAVFYSALFKDQDRQIITEVAKIILQLENAAFCLGNALEGRLQWMIGASEGTSFPFDKVRDDLFKAVDGRGGGKDLLRQGSGSRIEGFEEMVGIMRGAFAKS